MNEEQQVQEVVSEQNEVKVDTQPLDAKEAEKQFSKDDVNNIVAKRVDKLNKQWQEKFDALQESIKLQAMDEKQKAEYQAQKEREAFEEERKQFYAERDAFNKAQYKAEIQRQLQENGLPDISDTLLGMEAEQVKAQIDTMKQAFDAQVNTQIENRIKSSATTPTVPQEEAKPLTLEDVANMSQKDFKANKSEIEKAILNAFKN